MGSVGIDIAVSFAGEQRDYVQAVVRGVGDDVKVFYDEDEKAKLWGENLVDLLTDLYQHKARYVVMFVSAAYATKMWPNLERQSAMATATQQRSAYILPVRMDDTELPGLLPTVGHLDARHEGLDGIVRIIREKLALSAPHLRTRGGCRSHRQTLTCFWHCVPSTGSTGCTRGPCG